MEKEWEARAADGSVDPDELLSDEGGGLDSRERGSPTWRGLVIAVVAAIVLSVATTMLFGGSFLRGSGASAASAGCGPKSACCPPVAGGK